MNMYRNRDRDTDVDIAIDNDVDIYAGMNEDTRHRHDN
jgi:hypothetical protein